MKKTLSSILLSLFVLFGVSIPTFASEADLVVPNIKETSLDSYNLLIIGLIVSVIGIIFGFIEYLRIKKIDVHEVMANVGNTIFETCKTYLIQQGKFLLILEALIGLCIVFYFGFLEEMNIKNVLIILGWSVIGILGSYSVAWFGIRMNTLANSRTSFTALKGNPLNILNIPLKAGLSPEILQVLVLSVLR